MWAHHVSMAVQNELMAFMRTGHPVIDGIIASVILSLMAFLAMHAGYVRAVVSDAYQRSFHNLFRSEKLFTLCVFRDVCESFCISATNIDYQALVWFLSERARFSFSTTQADLMYYRKPLDAGRNVEKFMPSKNCPVTLMHNDKRISFMFTQNEAAFHSNQQSTIYLSELAAYRILLTLRSRDDSGMEELRSFVKSVRESFFEHERKQAWRQMMFRIKFKTGASPGTVVSNESRDALPPTVASKDVSRAVTWQERPTHSSRTFDTLVMDKAVKNNIEDDFYSFLRSEEWYKAMGMSYKRGYLFYGPPGTGKTSLVLAMSNAARYNIYVMDLSKLRTDEELESAFESLPERCIVLLEDIDCMTDAVKARRDRRTFENGKHEIDEIGSKNERQESGRSGGGHDITLSSLLNNLDGVGSNHGRIFIMTSNHPELLDPALIRHGRIDLSVKLGNCSHEQIRQLFRICYGEQHASHLRLITNTDNAGDATLGQRQDDNGEEQNAKELNALLQECAEEVCRAVPERVISPAMAVNVMQRHKKDPKSSAKMLSSQAQTSS